MTCEQVQEGLREYLDAASPLGSFEAVEIHLQKCQVCQREVDELRRTIQCLGAVPRPEMPHGMKDALIRALRGRQSA